MRTETLRAGEREYLLLGVVKGLKCEYDAVLKSLGEFGPDAVCVGISPEEVEGLIHYLKEPFEYDVSDYEVIYARHLSRFGEVFLPPPAYVAAVRYAVDRGVSIEPLDMDDEKYANAYVAAVSGWDLIRHSIRKRRLYRKKFRASTPEEVAILLDREIRKVRGYDMLEKTRERHMANHLLEVEGKRVAAVVEVERFEGVVKALREKISPSGLQGSNHPSPERETDSATESMVGEEVASQGEERPAEQPEGISEAGETGPRTEEKR